MKRVAAWSLVVALALAPLALSRDDAAAPTSLARRLLGPIASAAASVQWIRVDAAIDRGRPELALARADTALALDPGATDGWLFLANHLAFHRASAEREPDPDRRRAWIRAALELAARGERTAREPAQLARWQGLVRATVAENPDLTPPERANALYEAACADFERAAALGLSDGTELAEAVRRRMRD